MKKVLQGSLVTLLRATANLRVTSFSTEVPPDASHNGISEYEDLRGLNLQRHRALKPWLMMGVQSWRVVGGFDYSGPYLDTTTLYCVTSFGTIQ